MARKMVLAGLVIAVVGAFSTPAAAMPKETFDVPLECPSGDQTVRFVDNEGSIVGFDENGRVVQIHQLDGQFELTVTVEGFGVVLSGTEAFGFERGKGAGLKGQLEKCSFDFVLGEFSGEITPEIAADFAAEFGSDVLSEHLGRNVHVRTTLQGDAWLKRPGR